ncbi:MAG: hypothetical protein ACI4TW_08915 [Prevotella sp.]
MQIYIYSVKSPKTDDAFLFLLTLNVLPFPLVVTMRLFMLCGEPIFRSLRRGGDDACATLHLQLFIGCKNMKNYHLTGVFFIQMGM